MSVARLIDEYLRFADRYYRHVDGTCTGETTSIRKAVCVLRHAYGRVLAQEFGPLRLKDVRERMVAKGWCRKTINNQVGRIKRMFKWAAENELVSPDVYHGLQAVPGLKLGRTAARESPPVKPAPEELVAGVLPHVSDQVAAMIRLQLLTGMRPGEVCIMRTADVDRSGAVWVYRPARHKTEHHAHERHVYLGPQAQQVVTPFLRDDRPDAYLFSAAEAEREWRRRKHARRTTPLGCGNVPGSNRRRRPKVKPGHVYRRDSYTRAISRACEAAFPPPEGLTSEQEKEWRKAHHWHPHQLRHNAATRLRKDFGIDAAQVILGHKTLAVTAIYAEKDVDRAKQIMQRVG
jgi:integrase